MEITLSIDFSKSRDHTRTVTKERATLWRHRDFLKLWAGQAISELGTYVTLTALPFTAALVLHATSAQMGLLVFAGGVPTLFGLVAGVWVDRLRRRLLMVVTDILRCFLLLVIPVAAWAGALHSSPGEGSPRSRLWSEPTGMSSRSGRAPRARDWLWRRSDETTLASSLSGRAGLARAAV